MHPCVYADIDAVACGSVGLVLVRAGGMASAVPFVYLKSGCELSADHLFETGVDLFLFDAGMAESSSYVKGGLTAVLQRRRVD